MDASKREIKRQDGTTIKTSEMMEVYFRRIETLIKSDALDSRHSFMLQDLVDLRNENWVERRKVKKKYTVHSFCHACKFTVVPFFLFSRRDPKRLAISIEMQQ